MGQFRANIFLIRITSTYFWASEVFRNQSFKSQLFSSSHSPSHEGQYRDLAYELLNFGLCMYFNAKNDLYIRQHDLKPFEIFFSGKLT